jgi:hypothetical protein
VPYVHAFRLTAPDDPAILWDTVYIEEATTTSGPWTQIDSQAWPDQTTPGVQESQEISTSLATLEQGWYRFRWRDGSAYSTYSVPVYTPTGTSPYFTLEEFRARYTDLTAKTDDQIINARTLAEQAYELAIGFSPTPRTTTRRVLSVDGRWARFPDRFIRSITSATDRDGATITLTSPIIDGSDYVEHTAGWGNGYPLTVTYQYGQDAPTAVDVNAVLILTRHFLVGSNSIVDDRATGIPNDIGIVDLTVWPREVNRAVELRRIPSIG